MPVAPLRRRVMIVDASRDEREMYADWLYREGYCILQASSVPDAMRLAVELAPEVVVTEVRLAEPADGLELIHRLKGDPATCAARVVVVSGTPTAALMRDDNCDVVLAKPCAPAALGRAISRLLRRPAGPHYYYCGA